MSLKQLKRKRFKIYFEYSFLLKKTTCAYGEDLQQYKWQTCDGYYEAMFD